MFQLLIDGDRHAGVLRWTGMSSRFLAFATHALPDFIRDHRSTFKQLWIAAVIVLSLSAGYMLRFDLVIPRDEMHHLKIAIGIALIAKMTVFYFLGTDRGWWRFVGIDDVLRIFAANIAASTLFTLVTAVAVGRNFPRSIYVIDFLLCFLASCAARFSVRLYHEKVLPEISARNRAKGLLIYGAGTAGLNLIRELRSTPNRKYRVIGFLDDDAHKQHATLLGVPVLGRGREAAKIVDRYRNRRVGVDEIVIAMPTASGRQVSEALANCRASGVPCKTIPSFGELLAGKVCLSQIREIAVENLLGREPVNLQLERIRESIMGHSVMVTGAGGSIGSELCRQLVQFQPKCLVALDQAESELFKIDMELADSPHGVIVCPVIGDIRNYDRLETVVRQFAVTSIYHAAAYKHVPMMENNLIEAVNNNVVGLHNLVQIAVRNGVASFVMISSDKAVNPTNIMGLTKRVAELVVSSMPTSNPGGTTRFVSVRFGNVLGSNGSVVPIFKAQIASGGPVTITHPEMRRYFMTTPEAVQLVLQAATMGKGSEIFVLDMGEPVRILDLARNMIRLSGHEPDVEIPIRVVGLRPGEKLYEELSAASDQVRPTCHEKIMIFCGRTLQHQVLEKWIGELRKLVAQRDDSAVLAHMLAIVPEYRPSDKWRTALKMNQVKAAVGNQTCFFSNQIAV
jgi:FlaA1/EpsC-like NDP-sugar epimerase